MTQKIQILQDVFEKRETFKLFKHIPFHKYPSLFAFEICCHFVIFPSHLQNGSLNFFNLTPGNNHYRHAENTTPKRSMVARHRHLSKIGSDRRLIPVNRPESPLEFWTKRVGSFNEVLFFGAVGYLKKKQNWDDGFKSSSDAYHLAPFLLVRFEAKETRLS